MSIQIEVDKFLKAFHRISIQDFVELSNFNKKSGFYNSEEAQKIGRTGHFITSPEISSIFGRAVFNQFMEKNKNIKKIHLLELGPGNGYLTSDILELVKKNNIEIISLTFVEKSEYFKKRLDKFKSIKNFSIISRIEDFDQIDDELIFIYSNEFFDTFGHKQYLFINNEFQEIVITKEHHAYRLSRISSFDSKYLEIEFDFNDFSKGDILEYSPLIDHFTSSITKKLKNFYFTTNDYGYEKYPKKSTLRALKNHKRTALFKDFENVDYSFSVDFNRLKNKFLPFNAKVISQSNLIKKYAPEFFNKNNNSDIQNITDLLSGTKDNQMGRVFKNFTVSSDTKIIV